MQCWCWGACISACMSSCVLDDRLQMHTSHHQLCIHAHLPSPAPGLGSGLLLLPMAKYKLSTLTYQSRMQGCMEACNDCIW